MTCSRINIISIVMAILTMLSSSACAVIQPIFEEDSQYTIAYSYVSSNNIIVLRDSENISREIETQGGILDLKISPDGHSIAWVVIDYKTDETSMWVQPLTDDTPPYMVIPWEKNYIGFHWSPTNDMWFVFEYESTKEEFRITNWYTLSTQQQTHDEIWFEKLAWNQFDAFSISSDWKCVTFISKESAEIKLETENGHERILYIPPLDNPYISDSGSWAPDSKHLLISTYGNDPFMHQYQLLDVTTGEFNKLDLDASSYIEVMDWSPNSEWIVFSRHTPEYRNEVCVAKVIDVANTTKCLGEISIGVPARWISDSELLIVTSRLTESKRIDLYHIDLSDDSIKQITNDAQAESNIDVWYESNE